ncbi:hypothetical protein D9Q98_002936 [Chlorella vulgaris]|uniref:Uncharacterized protein n=1 Tax=Chlorella vulgaris TaxID=3077 RepID=A0A9D4TUB2_CHLVU|nr:hypothetical protein D9Q98_002936 [Chlorella vulgaris]
MPSVAEEVAKQPEQQHAQQPQPHSQARDHKRTSLFHQVKQVEPVTDRLLGLLPEWVRTLVQDRRRTLLYLERRVQRGLIREFKEQARELQPVLRCRGVMVGETLLEAFTSSSAAEVTYGELVASSLPPTVSSKLPRELLTVMDPLLTPFIDPFVEGLKQPLLEKAAEVRTDVMHSVAATAAACLVAGFLLGRYLPGGGGGGSSGGSGNSSGSGGRR